MPTTFGHSREPVGSRPQGEVTNLLKENHYYALADDRGDTIIVAADLAQETQAMGQYRREQALLGVIQIESSDQTAINCTL